MTQIDSRLDYESIWRRIYEWVVNVNARPRPAVEDARVLPRRGATHALHHAHAAMAEMVQHRTAVQLRMTERLVVLRLEAERGLSQVIAGRPLFFLRLRIRRHPRRWRRRRRRRRRRTRTLSKHRPTPVRLRLRLRLARYRHTERGEDANAFGRETADEDAADDARRSIIAEHLKIVLARSDGPPLKVSTRTLECVCRQIGGFLLLTD